MRTIGIACLLLLPLAANAANFEKVYNGTDVVHGILLDSQDGGCGTLQMNADGSYENGYAWTYAGIVEPYYGAFAECYSGTNQNLCSAVFDFTQVGNDFGQTMDVYVWDDAGGIPGNVICTSFSVDPTPIAFWPSISRHTVPMTCDCLPDNFWLGYWGDCHLQVSGWYIAADLDGLGGCPMNNIAPGIGFPTGWNSVTVVWGPTQAIGIGCETVPCGPVPARESSWGGVKGLYRG